MRGEENIDCFQPSLTNDSKLKELLQAVDWSQTPLGTIETWSESLQAAVPILLNALDFAKSKSPYALQPNSDALESISDGFFVLDRYWQFTYINQAGGRLVDRSPEDLMGKNFLKEFPGVYGTEFQELHYNSMYGRLSGTVTAFYPDHNRWYEVHSYPAADGIASYFRDVTEQKKVEIAAQEDKERLNFALEAAQFGDWDLDLRTKTASRSVKHDQIFGYETLLPEWSYDIFRNHVLPEEREEVDRTYRVALENKQPWDFECRIRRVDGQVRWIWARGYIYHNAEGEATRMVGLVADITDRKQRDAGLADLSLQVKRQSNLFDTVLSTVSDYIFSFDRAGRFLFVNQVTVDLLGLPQDQILGQTMTELNYPEEAKQKLLGTIEQVFSTGQTAKDETFFKSPVTGESGYFEYILSPLFAADGTVEAVVGSSRDITDRKQTELAREQLLKQEQATRLEAERTNRIKDNFLAVLSHELRTPLSPITGWARILRHTKLSAEQTDKALETIERNAQLQVQLIDDLLDISRILQGKLTLNSSPLQLSFVISAALETVRLAIDSKAIQLKLAIDTEVGQVLGDTARLQQVVWNLLSNAAKFTSPRGQIEVSLTQIREYAQIQVKDNGKGIHPNFLPHVFEHFRQGDDQATTRQFGGLGLGLAIAKQIVELHGGTISVESPGEGLGATFTVQLPLASVPLTVQQPPAKAIATDLVGLSILLVDDEADMRDLAEFILERQGAEVEVAASAREALEILEQFKPDLLISDIGMPDTDGYTLMLQVRERYQTLPAIALTAYAGEFNQKRAFAVGFQQHLAKPIEPAQLVQAIVTLMSDR